MRRELIDLLDDAMHDWDDVISECQENGEVPPDTFVEHVADCLICNGVTVQEWVSVEDRLPEKEDANPDGSILAIDKIYAFPESWGWDTVTRFPKEFTYWMPMPKPQKGQLRPTNADRIRAMSDEELAKFFCKALKTECY